MRRPFECPFGAGNGAHEKTADLSVGGFGAGDEARTRYLHLGKVALYQMSYARIHGAQGRS